MRFPILLTCLGASALAISAHAQDVQGAPSADQPVSQMPPAPSDIPAPVDNGTSVAPPPDSSASEPDAAAPPPPPAAYNAVPATSGPTIVMGPPQPQVQETPAPPAEYPPCSKTVKDACTNPGGS